MYGGLVFGCTFVPAIGHTLAPGGVVGTKQDAFLAIYLATFPLSLASTFIFLMMFGGWFEDDRQRLVAAGIAIVASAVWGIGFGQSYADMQAISHLHGHPFVVAIGVVMLALFSYWIYYGWVLFIAGILSSLFLAMWLQEKSEELRGPGP
jgi:hypothetical protein